MHRGRGLIRLSAALFVIAVLVASPAMISICALACFAQAPAHHHQHHQSQEHRQAQEHHSAGPQTHGPASARATVTDPVRLPCCDETLVAWESPVPSLRLDIGDVSTGPAAEATALTQTIRSDQRYRVPPLSAATGRPLPLRI